MEQFNVRHGDSDRPFNGDDLVPRRTAVSAQTFDTTDLIEMSTKKMDLRAILPFTVLVVSLMLVSSNVCTASLAKEGAPRGVAVTSVLEVSTFILKLHYFSMNLNDFGFLSCLLPVGYDFQFIDHYPPGTHILQSLKLAHVDKLLNRTLEFHCSFSAC